MAQAGMFAFDWVGYPAELPVAAPAPVYQPPLIWPAGPSPEQLAEIGKEGPKRKRERWRITARVTARVTLGFAVRTTLGSEPGIREPVPAPVWWHLGIMQLGMRAVATEAYHDPYAAQRQEEDEWLLGVR